MSTREYQSWPTPTLQAPAAASAPGTVSGYIDRIEGRSVTGWAWCRTLPDTAVEVEIRLDDRLVATTRADRFRRDLAEAQIGDGRHAFEATLDEAITADARARITAAARCTSDDPFIPLVNRTLKAPADAKPPAPTTATVSEPQLTTALQSLADVVSAVRRQANELEKDVRGIAETLSGMSETHASLARQLAAVEVFQARIDVLVAGLDRREPVRGSVLRRERDLVIAVGIAITLAVLSLGCGLVAVLG